MKQIKISQKLQRDILSTIRILDKAISYGIGKYSGESCENVFKCLEFFTYLDNQIVNHVIGKQDELSILKINVDEKLMDLYFNNVNLKDQENFPYTILGFFDQLEYDYE